MDELVANTLPFLSEAHSPRLHRFYDFYEQINAWTDTHADIRPKTTLFERNCGGFEIRKFQNGEWQAYFMVMKKNDNELFIGLLFKEGFSLKKRIYAQLANAVKGYLGSDDSQRRT